MKESSPNPYLDEELANAQRQYHPQKNKEFEAKHDVKSSTTTTAAPPPASQPPPASSYEPERPPMEIKRKIEDYFHTSYPINISEDVFKTKTDLIRIRRYFHVNPELSWKEEETAKHIANYCDTLGLVTRRGVGRTGVVAVLHGEHSDGKCIALRADMDALPIEEQNCFDYRSRVKGVSHACGHDCHMAILLTVARVLSMPKYVKLLHGAIRFIFQPAEEGGAGAKFMIEDGALREDLEVLSCPAVDEVYGLHVWSYSKMGKIVLKEGPLMAGATKWTIRVKGVGGHGAEPKGTRDTVLAMTQLAIELHSIVSRDLSPVDCGVLTIGTINVGDAANVIAENGTITGTVRYLRDDIFQVIRRRMLEIAEGIRKAFGVEVDIEWGDTPYPPVINRAQNVQNVRNAVKRVFPEMDNVIIDRGGTTMAAEDFSFYLNEKPGCFFFLGCGVDEHEGDDERAAPLNATPQRVLQNIEDGDEKKTKIYAHHTPHFKVDERCLVVGVQIMVNLIMDLMTRDTAAVAQADAAAEAMGKQGMNGVAEAGGPEIEDKMLGDSK